MNVNDLLSRLPAYRDEWVMIEPKQTVKDIIHEVLNAHDEFAPYYDDIALCFDGDSVEEVCDKIGFFLSKNLYYKEETEDDQTTLIPAGILIRGSNKNVGIDCKHYSGFSGGILDALNRTGKKIKWCYRFASYRFHDRTPHHVFIVVNPGENEIWIDPTPKANVLTPFWQTDKKIKASPMAIRRNIGFIDDNDYLDILEELPAIGRRPFWQLMPVEGARGNPTESGDGPNNPYFSGPFLALQFYLEDGLSTEGTNWQTTADAINHAIAQGPAPGHTVDGDFVKWIFDNSFKGYNFYYPGGVQIGYTPNLPVNFPHLVITDDGMRLTFDRDQKVDDYKTPETQALTSWINSLIYEHDDTPQIQKPRDIKEFSQGLRGSVATRNFFNMARRKTFLREVGNAVGDAFKFVGHTLVIVGMTPFRNAFLGLVGLNAFNFAGNLQEKIDEGKWDDIASTWRKIGGNPDNLLNTIHDGAKKKALLGYAEIGVAETGITGLLAAAAPVISLLLKYLDKNGKATEVLSAVKGVVQAKFPDLDLTQYGFLDKRTGQKVDFKIEDKDDENSPDYNPSTGFSPITFAKQNPIPVAAGLGLITYLITGKKGYMVPAVVGIGTYFLLTQTD